MAHPQGVDPKSLADIQRYAKLFWLNNGPYNNLTARKFVLTITPAAFKAAVDASAKSGARFATGEAVGTVNPFNHVHLNIGWPGEEYNPLLLRLVQFDDRVPPTIPRGGVRLFDENGELFKQRAKGRLLVRGRVQVVVDAPETNA